MSSLNKVILIGNLGKDPEIRTFQSGGRVANFSVATSESWKDKATGEKKEKTEWHRVSVMNEGLVGVIERYVKKGTKVYIEGKLQTRKWSGEDGVERYSTEVVLSGFNSQLVLLGSSQNSNSGCLNEEQEAYVNKTVNAPDLDDDIPF